MWQIQDGWALNVTNQETSCRALFSKSNLPVKKVASGMVASTLRDKLHESLATNFGTQAPNITYR
ncbi:hypothetical protein N7532_003507 [Penicillium argentinense]|uniref:Uncharacterized protein n=1 Tax=Penicillium argentinense TaxID=1131581 RepID=A0A9W9FMS9_9EURO|nr:uncharacterized protein N7532_003507 [Penicillium argentinense]KAJ5102978.1 hypothetical protein N7532_003507 [Penicillium argentinense]